MAFHIFIAKHPTRVDRPKYAGEVVESRIQSAKCLRTEVMCLGPMRPAAVTAQNSFKTLEQHLVRDLETVGFKLDNPYPTSPLSVAGTKPDVVTVGESHFDREMRAETIGVRELAHQPIMQIMKTGFRIFVGDSPFGSVLRISTFHVKDTKAIINRDNFGADQP